MDINRGVKPVDYKKLIKSRELRIRILQLLNFVPDKLMVSLQYRIKLGRWPDLKNPKRYSEKLQWYKLYYRDDKMKRCVDKYEVREYIRRCGLCDILPKCYGVYSSPDEVDFDLLPKSFVIKDTLGSGGNSVIIVKDKEKVCIEELIKKMHTWVNQPVHLKNPGREWVYDHMQHRIIIEEYLNEPDEELKDYKFFCFNGKVACVYVIANRILGGHGELAIMDENFVRIPYQSTTQNVMRENPEKPQTFETMKKLAEQLSAGFPHVRVDLYSLGSRVVFGELTFFGASGYMKYEPDEFDFILGGAFALPK